MPQSDVGQLERDMARHDQSISELLVEASPGYRDRFIRACDGLIRAISFQEQALADTLTWVREQQRTHWKDLGNNLDHDATMKVRGAIGALSALERALTTPEVVAKTKDSMTNCGSDGPSPVG